MSKAFIYTRVSTKEQMEEGYSLGEQEDRLKKYCEAMGWTVGGVYVDGGYSGGSMERPALQRMLSDIKTTGTDIVLVDKLDRLSRSQFDTLYLIRKVFMPNDIAFVSRAEAFDTSTPFGRAMIGILAVFAELERERIKERMAEGKAGRIKEGKFHGGNNVSLGYDYDHESGYLVANEYESVIVQEMFELVAKRIPFGSVAKMLNDKGYRSKNGTTFSPTVIRQTVTNNVYIGMQKYKGEWVPCQVDQIISEDLFYRVQDIMKERDITYEHFKVGKKYTSALSGLVWCARCGAKYQYKKRSNCYPCYVCYSRSKTSPSLVRDPNCMNTIYHTNDLENIVYDEIKDLKNDKSYIARLNKSVDNSHKIKTIQDKIVTLDGQINKLLDLYSLDNIDINTVKAKIDTLSAEKKALSKELESTELKRRFLDKDEVLKLVQQFEDVEHSGDPSLIHDAIIELVDHIDVDGDNIKIHWRF